MAEELTVYEVFTPSRPARVNFVPRARVNDDLVDAIRTPGTQIVIFGETGSGKSSLLLKKLDELYPDHLTTRCHGTMTFDAVLLDAFDQLDPFFNAGATTGHSSTVRAGLTADFFRVRASVDAAATESGSTSIARVLPPQLTPQRLAAFLGAQGLCWVLEDFHKIPESEKRHLSEALKIFADAAGEYPDVKVIALGATATAREVVGHDEEMRQRVAEIPVPLMDEDELYELLANGEELLNVDFSGIARDIVTYSSGLAGVCHQLALYVCLQAGVLEPSPDMLKLTKDDLLGALEHYVRTSSDTLKATFERALRRERVRKYDNTRLIIETLARGPLEGLVRAEILQDIQQKRHSSYPPANLTQYLRQLTSTDRGEILRLGTDGRYRFADPLYHVYAQVVILPDEPEIKDRRTTIVKEFRRILLERREEMLIDESFWEPIQYPDEDLGSDRR